MRYQSSTKGMEDVEILSRPPKPVGESHVAFECSRCLSKPSVSFGKAYHARNLDDVNRTIGQP